MNVEVSLSPDTARFVRQIVGDVMMFGFWEAIVLLIMLGLIAGGVLRMAQK